MLPATWSSWNNLNASRSVDSFDTIHAQRVQNLFQLALGIVLLRHQWSSRRHFHWEQPRRSLMFKSPLLRELFEKTYNATFDMCKVGQLRDPENNKMIQKGLEVRTTSWEVFSQLHGRYCNHNHEHQVLEGTTVHKGVRKNRTEFSELYPRNFARMLAKLLTSFANRRQEPKDFSLWNEILTAVGKRLRLASVEPRAKRPTSSKKSWKKSRKCFLGLVRKSCPRRHPPWGRGGLPGAAQWRLRVGRRC